MPLLFSPILPSLCGILRIFFPIIRCSLFPLLLRSHGIHGTLFQRGCNWLNLVASSKIMCEVLFHILPEWCRRFLFFGFLQVGLFTSLFLVSFSPFFFFLFLSFILTHSPPYIHPSLYQAFLPGLILYLFSFLINVEYFSRYPPKFLLFRVSVASRSLPPHGLQHARLTCPSPSLGVCSDSCPLSWWCHPTMSSSDTPRLLLPSIFPSIRVFSSY